VHERLLAIDGVVERGSMFSGRSALWVNGKEIAHRDPDGAYDVRLTRQVILQMRDRLREDPRMRLRPSSSSDWVEVRVSQPRDEDLLVELVSVAATAHRPQPGPAGGTPPRGPELARRRRFR
jgi:Family of unknown function (DUF5519)